MRKRLILGLSLACLQLSAFAAAYKEQTVMIATANPANSQHDIAIQGIKKYLEEKSGGAITVKVFLNGTMGDEQANVKQLRTNELQIATVFTGNIAPSAPILNILTLPYLFPDPSDAANLLKNKDFTSKLAEIVVSQNRTRPLGWILGGYRHITNAKHAITKMSDLQGLKLRVSPSVTQLEVFRAWGIEPHPMAWAEVFNALQQGVIDGQENPFFTIRDNKFWEVQKYVTELHYMLWTGGIAVSEIWYQRLDPDTKALVEEAVASGQDTEWKWVADQEDLCKQLAIDHGMTVNPLEDEPAWVEKARAIWPKFYDLIGNQEMIQQALDIIKSGGK
ncbi:MAG: TRAP transporter substrate-binding protein [Planctomycetota bacterium]|jgi:tripartite ATP-independent transporter DctP family solute receptor|nr:TRAP transporter substrate-binding protein [Planctomycetota bacterium]